jgi:hypothetical protein
MDFSGRIFSRGPQQTGPASAGGCASQRKADRQMSKPTEEQIRVRAHELWEKAGKPEGREDEFWRQAEKEMTQGATSDEKSTTFLE